MANVDRSQPNAQSSEAETPATISAAIKESNTSVSRTLQLDQTSGDRTSKQPTLCFRISNIPSAWTQEKLLQVLRSSNVSLGLPDGQLQLSLYPSCYNSDKTAILKLTPRPGYLRDLPSNEDGPLGIHDINLVVDRHFYGLTPLNAPKGQIIADVVAVTGLAGHAFGSWRNRENGHMWLQDSLPNAAKGLRVMTYGYNTVLTGSGTGTNRLMDHRRSLIEQLESARGSPEERHRPIFFVGHSLGGILISQVLVQSKAHARYRHVLEATRALFFFGTPFYGMRTAELEAMVEDKSSGIEVQSMKLLQQLREGSDFLEDQKDELFEILNGRNSQLEIFSYYETVETHTVKKSPTNSYVRNGELVEMVKKFSAQLYLPNERRTPVSRNHTDMVKFLAPSDVTYQSILSRIRNCVDNIMKEREQQNKVVDKART